MKKPRILGVRSVALIAVFATLCAGAIWAFTRNGSGHNQAEPRPFCQFIAGMSSDLQSSPDQEHYFAKLRTYEPNLDREAAVAPDAIRKQAETLFASFHEAVTKGSGWVPSESEQSTISSAGESVDQFCNVHPSSGSDSSTR